MISKTSLEVSHCRKPGLFQHEMYNNSTYIAIHIAWPSFPLIIDHSMHPLRMYTNMPGPTNHLPQPLPECITLYCICTFTSCLQARHYHFVIFYWSLVFLFCIVCIWYQFYNWHIYWCPVVHDVSLCVFIHLSKVLSCLWFLIAVCRIWLSVLLKLYSSIILNNGFVSKKFKTIWIKRRPIYHLTTFFQQTESDSNLPR